MCNHGYRRGYCRRRIAVRQAELRGNIPGLTTNPRDIVGRTLEHFVTQ